MSDNTDIAARTQRFREAVRAFTPPGPKRYAKLISMKEGIIELREKGASLRLIRELLLTVDVSVSIDTIARFLAEMNGEKTSPRRVRAFGKKRRVIRRTNEGPSASPAAVSNRHLLRHRSVRTSKRQRIPNDRAPVVLGSPIRTISESTHFRMNKQINLIINGKGGVGKSFFATNFVQYLEDCGIEHHAIDSDHENSTLKRFHPEAEFH